MNNFSKGYGFRPSDGELIGHLRNRTLLGGDYFVQDITDLGIDICKWEPWDLPGLSMATSSDPVWYFLYPVTYKNPKTKPKMMNKVNGKRKPINRATNEGKWKPSGNPVKVRASDSNKEIGIKRHLYFFTSAVNEKNDNKSKAKTTNSYHNKTPWVLYEYELTDVHPNLQVQLGFDQPLVEMEVSNGYDWMQNQSSVSEQVPVDNYETYPEERCDVNDYEVSNLPCTFENYVAHDAIPQNLQVDYPVERSNEHNVIAGNEGLDLSYNFNNHPIADNLFDFGYSYLDGLYLDELFGALEAPNNHDGVQNQSSTNQQDADEFRNSNFINNEIAYPDGTSKAAAAEIEGSNLPSWGIPESSYPMESSRKRSCMEHEGSSADIETEVAPAQAKKSRI
ncbi:NAC domain-containing protein 91-like isoform X2 [Herrania umbratica]|uniref:NAC domain-containing protein 91-like isoform X2 n=1 Tax=Herrania umbratica TaxID=108875 RepID=A0A6J1AWN8_9ROSI|nr:NAC domain-containing protein 91-like isoform X2 [Herrania umbratica]